ncbi:hypothetical protein [Paenibacillus wenxiniae]|uniref:DUF4352 domain-containing protein n=1 Tax=Paenibacillus wenxiniae TaxID=1636843 RepID=A0ABW4RPP6_9BACL
MNKMYSSVASMLLMGGVLISGCGNQAPNTATSSQPTSSDTSSPSDTVQNNDVTSSPMNQQQGETDTTTGNEVGGIDTSNESSADGATENDQTANSNDILIIIDQTEKPIEDAGMFNFSIQHLPKGYRLDKMSWTGKGKEIVNTYKQAIENGGTGGPEDGSFYISGDGQFSGFSYPESRKGEQGTVAFTFVNDAEHEIKWEKKLTLK